ncbi:MAG TPA: MDR family oxidoreductase [Solirubrobacteraceae bacterium]|jgi:acrylyl-CoA reductase (NADPH)|nr:MDR family oxidoreductase [Solirubrobacteraceae bacterium]
MQAIVATEKGVPASLRDVSPEDLPEGDVTVAVSHSSLNYKDAMAVCASGAPIVRRFPMVCGIDLAGRIEESDSPDWPPGEEVIVTGFGLSETHPGGYTQLQRLRSEWLVRRPASFSAADCMAIGTAGLTAMLCVLALERAGVEPSPEHEVLVTGASGGVGSIAVALLAGLGHSVAASTGRAELGDWLRGLGARTIVARSELDEPGRPLESERWSGAVDTVGSQTLANVLAATRYRGAVAACGLAGGADLPASVIPFILRNVSLLGVDSVQCPIDDRRAAWARLERDLPLKTLRELSRVEPLARVPGLAADLLAGRLRGRVVIDTAAA